MGQFMRDASIRIKLTVIVLLSCVAALVLAGTTLIVYDRMSFKDSMVRNLEVLADVTGSNSTAAIAFDNQADATETLKGLQAEPHVISAYIYDKNSKLFASYHRDKQLYDCPPVEPDGYRFEKDNLVMFRKIELDGERIGTVCLKADLLELNARIMRYVLIVVIVTVLSLIVALAVISRLQRIVSEPIVRLADIAKTVSNKKDYSVRAESNSRDELGFLIRKFNEMLEQIQARDSALQKARDELEERVRQRTSELQSEIVERERTQRILAENERRFRSLIENGNDVITIVSSDGSIVYESPSVRNVFGYEPDDLLGTNLFDLIHEEGKTEIIELCNKLIEEPGRFLSFEFLFLHKDGTWKYVDASATNLVDDPAVQGIVINSRDITYRKQAEDQIRASLHEKEVLLKEIHHRVKNNLQVISSLLNLQSRKIDNPVTVEMLKDSQSRVKSMALIHERLYRSEDLSRVDFADYTKNLINFLSRSFQNSVQHIRFRVNVDAIFLSVDSAVPCGLIINELVSNSLKHGFPDRDEGEITIDFHRLDIDELVLRISDNGIGFPENIDFANTESLGMQLVNSLAAQLGGALELNRSGGTAFEIVFPEIKLSETVRTGVADVAK